MMKIDLHVHSNRSDGTLSPEQLVLKALDTGLSAFALTDHDTVDGIFEALSFARALRLEGKPAPTVIPGIEFSTEYQGRDIHILGLFIDYEDPYFIEQLKRFVDSRIARNQKMCSLLQTAGIDITYEKLIQAFPGCVITRAHYARYLLEHGYIRSMQEAFDRYIGDHCPYFVPREKITPVQAVELVLMAGGLPILAHPALYHFSDRHLEELVAELTRAGLKGLEAVYSTYTPSEERKMRSLAARYGLAVSGGSDFHGSNKPRLQMGCGYGKLVVPESMLTDLLALLPERSKAAFCQRCVHQAARLLFTDMDGTLLLDDSTISPAMKEGLDRMTKAGHHLILTSGRPLPSILEVRTAQEITYPNMLVISNNGALVYDCDRKKNILVHRLAMEDIRYIIGEAEKRKLHIHAYTENAIVCHGMNDELSYYTRRIHMLLKCVENIADSLTEGSFKLQAIHLTDRKVLEDFRDALIPHCQDRVQLIFSNDQYLEILPGAAGKGNAVRFVQEYLNAPYESTFAAGDAENDISMLKAACTGIAMANASAPVKECADLITKRDNNHDGLLEIIEQYFT